MRARTLIIGQGLLLSTFFSSNAHAWGERGHDAVARVAVRILMESEDPEERKLGQFLHKKENMLGHLANVPDIVWRSMGKEIDEISAPSHYVGVEYLTLPGKASKVEDMPRDMKSMIATLSKVCSKSKKTICAEGQNDFERVNEVGHNPFRIATMTEDIKATYQAIKKLEGEIEKDKASKSSADSEKEKDKDDPRTELVHKTLLYSGILSHFVGDLANPHHTARDYDGWETDQGGLHGYFETELISSYPLDFEQRILEEAQRRKPLKERFERHPDNYLLKAWELALESNSQLGELVSIDKKYSLLEKSIKGDRATRKRAKRKSVDEVRQNYRDFSIIRLAAGADALSRFWFDAWKAGGKPDLGFYRSYHYDVKPEFIPIPYLPERK